MDSATEQETKSFGEMTSAERIEHRRGQAIAPESIDEGVRQTAESTSQQIYDLKSELRHLHTKTAEDLPAHAYTDNEGERQERPATWGDISGWLKDGELQKYLDQQLRMRYPNKSEASIKINIRQKIKEVERALALMGQVKDLEGTFEDKKWDDLDDHEKSLITAEATRIVDSLIERSKTDESYSEYRDLEGDAKEVRVRGMTEHLLHKKSAGEGLNDEQKTARAFKFFKLRELVESRIMRRSVTEQIDGIREEKNIAREEKCWDVFDELEAQEQALLESLVSEIHSSPEAYYDYWGQELLEAQRVFSESGIIYETKSVKSKINKILSMLGTGQPVFIHGETGSGKTEVAKYLSKTYKGKDALVISGHRNLEFSAMTETQRISIGEQLSPEEQISQMNLALERYVSSESFQKDVVSSQHFEGMTEEEAKEKLIADYKQFYSEAQKSHVETGSDLHQIYQAAEEGRIVILDEMNAIPHHTLIALNDLLTCRPVSEEVYAQYQEMVAGGKSKAEAIKELGIDEAHHVITPVYGGDPILIAPGFGLIATGNWKPEDGKNYVGRQTLDAAFLRRFGVVSYDYMENPTGGELNDPNLDAETDRAQKQKAELYRMLCARLIDPDLTARIPENAFADLEKLAQVAKVIQDGFSGKNVPSELEPESVSGNRGKLTVEDVLHENVLDLGKLVQFVIEPWKKDNFQYPLEAYIFDRFMTRSSARPAEMMWLYKTFQWRGFFKSSEGWPEYVDLAANAAAGTAASTVDLRRIKSQKVQEVLEFGGKLESQLYGKADVDYNQEQVSQLSLEAPQKRFFSPTEIIDRVIGRPSARERYPDLARAVAKEGETVEAIEISQADQERRTEIREQLDELEAKMTQRLEIWEKTQLPDELQPTLGGEGDYCKEILAEIGKMSQLLNDPAATIDGENGAEEMLKELEEKVKSTGTSTPAGGSQGPSNIARSNIGGSSSNSV